MTKRNRHTVRSQQSSSVDNPIRQEPSKKDALEVEVSQILPSATWVASEWTSWPDALVHIGNISRSPRLCHAELKSRIDAGDISAVDRFVGVGTDQQIQTILLDLDFLRRATKHWAAAWLAGDILAAGRQRRNEPHPPDYGLDPWINGFDPTVFQESGQHHVFVARGDILKWWPNEPALATGALSTSDTSLPGTKRGPKVEYNWDVFKARFWLFLYHDDEPAYADINVHKRAAQLMEWGQNHPEIGGEKTPGDTAMREKVREWKPLWRLLGDRNK
jgi:hypothetical protein